MRAIRTGLTALVTVATIAAATTPAMARGGQGWGGGRHHDRHDGFDFGDFLLGGLLVGTVAVLAGSKAKGQPQSQDDGDYRGSANTGSDYATSSAVTSDGQGGIGTEDAAVDACAVAARDKASVDGGYAEVKSIETVSPVTDGWDVHGTLQHRSGYRNAAAANDGFTCTVRGGWVSGVDIATS